MKQRWPAQAHKRYWAQALAVLVVLVIIGGLYILYLFASSPSPIRDPHLQHYHFRMQVMVDGQPVSFANAKFQTPESNVSCDEALPEMPIHFHDDKDQIVHVHWDGMTGGLVLKNYGWNYIGGDAQVLGHRFDNLPHIQTVSIHGQALPAVPKGDTFYVYAGNAQSYAQHSFSDFLGQDLEVFFNHPSNLPTSKPKVSLSDLFAPKASAAAPLNEAQLTQLNNLIGNVVIFVQKQPPSQTQVQDRFNHLEPLSQSVCGS